MILKKSETRYETRPLVWSGIRGNLSQTGPSPPHAKLLRQPVLNMYPQTLRGQARFALTYILHRVLCTQRILSTVFIYPPALSALILSHQSSLHCQARAWPRAWGQPFPDLDTERRVVRVQVRVAPSPKFSILHLLRQSLYIYIK